MSKQGNGGNTKSKNMTGNVPDSSRNPKKTKYRVSTDVQEIEKGDQNTGLFDENSPEEEDEHDIGKFEQGKIKEKPDKEGTDHYDHGKPKEKPQIQDVFLYISVVLLVVVIACVTNRNESRLSDFESRLSDYESRLSDYDRKSLEMNENVKYLEMLKTLKIEVPEMKEKISTFHNHVIEANNRFQPLWTKLIETQDKLDFSEDKTKILEIEIKKIESDIVQMRTDSERLNRQSKKLSIKMDELIPQLKSAESKMSTLHQKMAETEERVLPSLERQNELIDTVFDYVWKTFIQAQTIKKSIGNMQQHASRTERRIFNLHGSVTRTESRFSELSNNVKTVEHHIAAVDDKHTQIVTRQMELNDNMQKSKNDIISLDNQLAKVKEEVADFKGKIAYTEEDMTQRLDKLSVNIAKAEYKMFSIKAESEGYNNRIDDLDHRIKGRIDELNVRTEKEERFTTYAKNVLQDVVSTLKTIKDSVYSAWTISVVNLLEIAAITYIFMLLFNGKYQDGYSQSSAVIQSEHHVSHTGTSSSVQRPSSVLDQIHRKPVMANTICILSFYAETQRLHKSLVTSAVELSRRGKTMQIVPHLVRRHEDILNIPSARYIFIFVDFNERNVILEKPDQNLGDKKVVTVNSAQKLGGDVFVTYVRDKGSSNLFLGHLYNINLSAFTTHPVLKPLEINQRCFSVYERYTNTQKEHIASVIV